MFDTMFDMAGVGGVSTIQWCGREMWSARFENTIFRTLGTSLARASCRPPPRAAAGFRGEPRGEDHLGGVCVLPLARRGCASLAATASVCEVRRHSCRRRGRHVGRTTRSRTLARPSATKSLIAASSSWRVGWGGGAAVVGASPTSFTGVRGDLPGGRFLHLAPLHKHPASSPSPPLSTSGRGARSGGGVLLGHGRFVRGHLQLGRLHLRPNLGRLRQPPRPALTPWPRADLRAAAPCGRGRRGGDGVPDHCHSVPARLVRHAARQPPGAQVPRDRGAPQAPGPPLSGGRCGPRGGSRASGARMYHELAHHWTARTEGGMYMHADPAEGQGAPQSQAPARVGEGAEGAPPTATLG